MLFHQVVPLTLQHIAHTQANEAAKAVLFILFPGFFKDVRWRHIDIIKGSLVLNLFESLWIKKALRHAIVDQVVEFETYKCKHIRLNLSLSLTIDIVVDKTFALHRDDFSLLVQRKCLVLNHFHDVEEVVHFSWCVRLQ